MSQSKSKPNLIRSVRIDDSALTTILDNLDAATEANPHAQRSSERFAFRRHACVVYLHQPGSSHPTAYQVATRNLSCGGLSFLHGGFVHVGSRCVVHLKSVRLSWVKVAGAIVGCDHVRGLIHEVRVRFDQSIDVEQFCPNAVRPTVLVAEDDPPIARLIVFHLEKLHADCVHVENGKQVVEEVQRRHFDLILMDMEMPEMDGFETVKVLRSRGYRGMIVAATALTDPADRERCLQAGCDAHIAKPYSKDDLANLFKSLGGRTGPAGPASPEARKPSLAELVRGFSAELPDKLRAIEEAFADQEIDRLESLARVLKGEAGAFGFEAITEKAAQIEHAARTNLPVDEIKAGVAALAELCAQAGASNESTAVGAGSAEAASAAPSS